MLNVNNNILHKISVLNKGTYKPWGKLFTSWRVPTGIGKCEGAASKSHNVAVKTSCQKRDGAKNSIIWLKITFLSGGWYLQTNL